MNSPAYALALLVMAAGIVCTFVPFVPGPPIVWLGALLYGWQTGWQGIGWLSLSLLFVIAIAGSTSDWWLSGLLLHRGGGSLWTLLASFVGGIIGFFVLPVLGVVVGSLIGVVLVELVQHRDPWRTFRAGRGFLVGYLLSLAVQVVAGLLMIGLFLVVAR